MLWGLFHGASPFFLMIYSVKIYDKDGKLKKLVSAETISKRSVRTMDLIQYPNMRYGSQNKATWRVYRCKNCGVRGRSKTNKALFCSEYCTGYWTKLVHSGKRAAFRYGGLDDYPEAKKELEARVASQVIYNNDEYSPVKRKDVRI